MVAKGAAHTRRCGWQLLLIVYSTVLYLVSSTISVFANVNKHTYKHTQNKKRLTSKHIFSIVIHIHMRFYS